MKVFFAFAMFLTIHIVCYGQETPRTTQYIFNNYLLNPAVAGIDNYTDVKIGYRKQWSGLEGSPSTQYVSIHKAIGDDFIRSSVNSFAGANNNPVSKSFVNNFTAAEPHHGIGLIAMTDKAGLVRQSSVNVSYAYHLSLSYEVNLSAGVNLGLNSLNIDVNNVKADHLNDPLFGADYNNRIRPDVGLGLWLYSPRFFLGASGKQLFGTSPKIVSNESRSVAYQKPSFYATGGYKLFIDEDIAAIPSFLVSYWSNAPVAIDLNAKFAYMDKFWLGASYRNNDSYSILAGFNLASLVNLSYSYDISTNALRSVNNGTHEIVLGFLLNNRYQVNCPSRQF